jgi:hypothetical protein
MPHLASDVRPKLFHRSFRKRLYRCHRTVENLGGLVLGQVFVATEHHHASLAVCEAMKLVPQSIGLNESRPSTDSPWGVAA